jgi:hypothetical protein
MNRKNRKKTIIILSSAVLVCLLFFVSLILFSEKKSCFDEENSKIDFSTHHPIPRYSINELSNSENYTLFRIVYESEKFLENDGVIYGLLYVPKNKTNTPGIVFLPGGSVRKEEEPAGPAIANLGYAVLVIDQRGIGETGGFYPNYEQDKLIFEGKSESIQHLGVYDALIAIDVLRTIDSVNKNSIMIGGSSMGGRYAMIAATMDSEIKGALILSSAGFHVEETPLNDDGYFLSIDPDRYVKDISPSKLIMIHSLTDDVIKLGDAMKTFTYASQPKEFYTVNNCTHGYCPDMLPFIEEELRIIFSENN